MKSFRFRILAVVSLVFAMLFSADCTPQEAKQATTTTLTAVERGCVFYSNVTDASALAKICNVVEVFLPIVRELIGARQDAIRAGLLILPPTALGDGGVPLPVDASSIASDAGKPGDAGKPADSGQADKRTSGPADNGKP